MHPAEDAAEEPGAAHEEVGVEKDGPDVGIRSVETGHLRAPVVFRIDGARIDGIASELLTWLRSVSVSLRSKSRI